MIEPDSQAATPLDYARPGTARRTMSSGKKALIFGILGAAMLAAAIAVFHPQPPHVESNRLWCASRLRQIGLACVMYANTQPNGEFPDSLQTMLKYTDITAEAFVCPSTSDTMATAAGPLSPGHVSYVYLGRGMTNNLASSVVLAYEPLSNHADEGMNVLYGDCHVEWLTKAQALRMLQGLRTPATGPSTRSGVSATRTIP